ncbi:MAG: HYR domain-containing protein, partial [Flavobacteriales bacterium]|nr:HYR domain-containing protein [Flavobacteriales bacterium]
IAMSDFCGIANISQDPAIGASLPIGSHVVTLDVTDANGNTTNCGFNLNVTDGAGPQIFSCVPLQQIPADADCQALLPDYTGMLAVAFCGGANTPYTVTQTPAVGTIISGTQQVDLLVEDVNGLTESCSFNVEVVDQTAPAIDCSGVNLNVTLNVNCQFIVPNITSQVSTSDNCGGAISVTQSPAAGTMASPSSTNVTLTATDQNGNQSSCTVTLVPQDVQAPSITVLQSDSTVFVDGQCKYMMASLMNMISFSDACGVTSISQSPAAGSFMNEGDFTVTFTVADAAGNSSQAQVQLHVVDNTPPNITFCNNNQIVPSNANCEAVLADYKLTIAASDNCSPTNALVVTQSPTAGTLIQGQTTVTLTVTDEAGNASTCVFNVTLTDSAPPQVTCPANPIEVSANDECIYELEDFTSLVTATDNCGIDEIIQSPAPGTELAIGDHTIQFTILDFAGNSVACSADITVADTSAPVFNVSSTVVELNLDENCSAELGDLSGLVIMETECSEFSISQSMAEGTMLTAGESTVTITVTDVNGNSTDQDVTVVVADTTAPIVDAPAELVINQNENCEFSMPDLSGEISASDNCTLPADLQIDQFPAASTLLTEGTTATLIVTDESGNATELEIIITPFDASAPVLDCPAAVNDLSADENCEAVVPDYTDLANATDCSPVNVSQIPEAGTTLTLGTFDIWLYATDTNGNQDSCVFQVEVADVTPPVFLAEVDDLILSMDENCTAAMPSVIQDGLATDNCDGELEFVQFPQEGELLEVGTHAGSLQVIDDAGNATLIAFSIEVTDTTPPVIACAEPLNIVLSLGCTYSVGDFTSLVQVEDCSGYVTTQSPAAGSIINESTTITFTVVDAFGNESNCATDIVLTDLQSPLIDCPGDQTIQVSTGCEMLIPDFLSTVAVSDNCTVSEYSQSPPPGTPMGSELTGIITLLAEDAAGNSSVCQFELIFVDTLAPQLDCPENLQLEVGADCMALLEYEMTSMEACEDLTWEHLSGPLSGDELTTGNYEVSFKATDMALLETVCTFNVEVVDVTAPEITCPDNIESCVPEVTFGEVVFSDNCEVLELVQTSGSDFQSGASFPLGTTTLAYDVSDVSGNSAVCSFDITILESLEFNWEDLPGVMCQDGVLLDLNEFVPAGLENIVFADPISANGTFNPADFSSGSMIFEVTASNGSCDGTASQEVVLVEMPSVDAGPDQEVCGLEASLLGTATGDVTWTASQPSTTILFANDTETDIISEVYGAQSFTLTASNLGCQASDVVLVTFFEAPAAIEAGPDQVLHFESATELEGVYTGAGTTTWSAENEDIWFDDATDLLSGIDGLPSGENIIYLTAVNGVCPAMMDSLIIFVHDLLIPTGFSPNGDGTNDLLVVEGLEDWPGSSIVVFNRWGKEVYSNDNYSNDWDGSGPSGSRLQDDTYFVVVTIDGIEHKGYLILKR